MSRGPDAATLLARAIVASGPGVTVTAADWRRWGSATFVGAQHVLTLNAPPSPTLDTWLAGLPEHAFTLRGHLVADLDVVAIKRTRTGVTAEIEVLTVEDR